MDAIHRLAGILDELSEWVAMVSARGAMRSIEPLGRLRAIVLRLREGIHAMFTGVGDVISAGTWVEKVPLVERIERVIETHMQDPTFLVDALARAVGMSRSTLARALDAVGAPGPGTLIREVRLERARRMLLTGDRSVADVAYAVGFVGPSQFARAFRAVHGTSPSRVRCTPGRPPARDGPGAGQAIAADV